MAGTEDLILQAGGVCAAIAAVAVVAHYVARPIWNAWKRINAFLEDWNGEPARPGRVAIPSMPERMSGVESRLTKVETQVTPNGGNTERLGDRVLRLEKHFGTEPDTNGS